MFKLYDNFVSCDTNRQPYSFSAERHTPIDNMHAWVKEGVFNMASIGNVYVMNTPKFATGTFRMNFKITYMAEFGPQFNVFFSYDEKTRVGRGIKFYYDLKDTLKISLMDINVSGRRIIETKEIEIAEPIREDTFYSFELSVESGRVYGIANGYEFFFETDTPKGKIALERDNFIGELIISDVLFTTEDEFECKQVVKKVKTDIPLVNGGDIPYTLSWEVNRIEGEYYLTTVLDGGTRTREVKREDRPGQYVAEKDWMTSPYVGIGNPDGTYHTFCIAKGEKAFVDPNIYWDCQKAFFGDTDLPISNTYPIPESVISDNMEIIIGYENLFCSGYATQEGGREFRFTPQGKFVYSGDAMDGRDIFEIYSPHDKYALSFVPEDCYKREEVIDHIKYNHYFDVEENIDLTFVMKTRLNTGYLSFETEILNVYESKVLCLLKTEALVSECGYGYTKLTIPMKAPCMKVGVYKARLNVYYGDTVYKNYTKVFEVYDKDTDENPALASGLPFQFSMPNEQKWLMRSAFDLWNPMPSCDIQHYYSCITDTPIEAQIRRPWTMTKKFKREWFAWISSRTCKDWDINKYRDVVENCDYLFSSINEEVLDLSQSTLFPMRQDHHAYENFMMRGKQRVAILEDFLRDNPQIADKVDYKIGMPKFTYEHYRNLMETCCAEWIEYQNAAGLEIIRKNNEEVRKINPKVKRAIYGPINVYVTPTLTNHSLKVYGNSDPDALSDEVFTGFAVYEDYPYSCAYQTYRGAFGLMTILLHSPRLTIYPEQYSGSRGGCIDGAVKFAHAPMGGYSLKPYMNSTHAYEFVFNTSYRLSDGYHYWNTYGFHRGANPIVKELVRDWRYVVDNKPKKPMRTTAFLAEYSNSEDVFRVYDVDDNTHNCYIMNQSEAGHGVLFECTRESGIPNGFALKYDALKSLKAEECDVLVLPTLKDASGEVIGEIRRLYREGVNLVAVSDITGLEDIFEVCADEHTARIDTVIYDGEREYVRPNDAKLMYRSEGAETVMTSDTGEPLIFRTNRALLINTDVVFLGGADSRYMCHAKTVHVIGRLLRKALKALSRELSAPLVLGENVGTTLFETEDGRCMLLAIDYSPFDNTDPGLKEAVIKINMNGITDVKSEREILKGRKGEEIKEIRFDIKPHESVFTELV